MDLSAADHAQLAEREWTPETVQAQLRVLQGPTPTASIVRPCVLGDGVVTLDTDRDAEWLALWSEASVQGRIGHFVPASGAATRMFASALLTRQAGIRTLAELSDRVAAGETAMQPALEALTGLEDMALWDLLRSVAPELTFSVADGRVDEVLEVMLDNLGLAQRPKGLVPFHRSAAGTRTPVAEHLEDAVGFAASGTEGVQVHFTVGAAHQARFDAAVQAHLRGRAGAPAVTVSFSHQRARTDCVAMDEAGELFRTEDGQLLFRPGGHGALLDNLASLGGDVVLIRNIDSVVPDRFREDVLRWRKRMVGLALSLERGAHQWLATLEDGGDWREGAAWLRAKFGREVDSADGLAEALRRPIRVCGMVANEGQPGGGPFWVRGADGISAQIVEGAQLDRQDPEQVALWNQSTHFNPVDMVCILRDRDGNGYHLEDFVDPHAWIVTEKRHGARALTALENPGLWNGAMARWNTVFVQIPGDTFNPVKTWANLLDERHRAAP